MHGPWFDAMSRGDFAAAWAISDRYLPPRGARGDPQSGSPEHHQVWRGEPLDGKRVLVRCHHGLGDTIQFIRFAAPLRRIARQVTVLAQPELVPLVATAPGVDRVVSLRQGDADLEYDLDIEIMELAHALRADATTIQCAIPYLFPPTSRRSPAWIPRPKPRRVGLVWRAGDWAPHRSVPAATLSPLRQVSTVRLYSLQRGAAAGQAALIPARDIGADDVLRTAAVLLHLDLLISVDTFAAHLAGALGVPTWLLLHQDYDWRWMRGRADSVWYPTMRLFRQTEAGDWRPVIAAVAARLQREAECAESEA